MSHALALAMQAKEEQEVPVGAVIIREGRILGEGHNRTVREGDPTMHAEIVAIRQAALSVGDWRLLGSTLYVTLEPCAMCAGAIVLARIPRVVCAAHDPKAGMAGSLDNLLNAQRPNHRCDEESGLLALKASDLIREFFRERR